MTTRTKWQHYWRRRDKKDRVKCNIRWVDRYFFKKHLSEERSTLMRYEDTEFVTMFRKFGGIKRVIMSIDFQLSLALGITFSVVTCYYGITKVIIAGVSPIFVIVSAAMIAIAFAGLAIVVSMSNPEFIKVLKHVGIYNNLLFMFWYSTIISGLSIIINTLSYAMQCITNENLYLSIFFLMSIFLVLYSIFSVILLVGTTMRYGLYRVAFIEQEKKGKKI